jgi:hypothetical protein
VDGASFSGAPNGGSASVRTKDKVLLTPRLRMQSVMEHNRQISGLAERGKNIFILKIRL